MLKIKSTKVDVSLKTTIENGQSRYVSDEAARSARVHYICLRKRFYQIFSSWKRIIRYDAVHYN